MMWTHHGSGNCGRTGKAGNHGGGKSGRVGKAGKHGGKSGRAGKAENGGMMRILQRKMVFIAMAAITILILLMLGVINIINIVSIRTDAKRVLQLIAENDGDPGNLGPPPQGMPPESGKRRMINDYDTFMSANFFVAVFDRDGNLIRLDARQTSAVSEEEAMAFAQRVYESGAEEGKIEKFRYLMQDSRMGDGKTLVFLDTSADRLSYIRVLLLSGSVGIACWVLMLVFVVLISKRAIRPIAENMERQKQFVTNAGHEIKTPLAIIQSNTEAMELYNGENKWTKNIREQTVRLDGLMRQLLTLARMEEGATKVNAEDLPVASIMDRMLRSMEESMEQKNITLHKKLETEVILHADRAQIEQLFSILLDNAVKYTNDGGQIEVRIGKKEKTVCIEVQNTCERLPEVPPDKLFDRFYRGDTARTQKSGGYGIGLSVAQSITAANRGKLLAVYRDPSTICFTVQF